MDAAIDDDNAIVMETKANTVLLSHDAMKNAI
jgi:hypothetical protein